jgi:dGTPase
MVVEALRQRAPYASDPASSRGRRRSEPPSPTRNDFRRDCDRIIHSSAFRRLAHKTQVFVFHEGDHFRTRLTHTLEVAQIARSLARALGLDEDLAEALALGHDLGHPPFGHAGERALDRCLAGVGGFDHNAQTLRTVTVLERRYAAFDGLNLTWETLEGLIKHNGPISSASTAVLELIATLGIDPSSYAPAEAQAAAIADDIAYNAHDIDDGLRAQLFAVIDLGDVPLAGDALSEVLKTWPRLDRARIIHETVRRVISWMISDVIAETGRRLKRQPMAGADQVRQRGERLVCFSAQMQEKNRALQAFLSARMYRHEKVMDIMGRAQRVVRDLFEAYVKDPRLLPLGWIEEGTADMASNYPRQVCDFIAGMTDRYALDQHKRLFDLDPLFR